MRYAGICVIATEYQSDVLPYPSKDGLNLKKDIISIGYV